MKKRSVNPSFNENSTHVWLRYEGKWLRFTEKAIEDAKRMAENNKHEAPSFFDRILGILFK